MKTQDLRVFREVYTIPEPEGALEGMLKVRLSSACCPCCELGRNAEMDQGLSGLQLTKAMTEIKLTKKHVAQRQLATAIRLLFGGGDDISIVSLAANAWEIIDCFCRASFVNSLSQQVRENVPQGKRLKLDYINSPYRNFFKHAESDLDAVLPAIETKFVDGLIFLAVEDYLRWSIKGPVEFQVFQAWYLCLYLEKVAESELDRISAATDAIFPNMRNLTRYEQIALGRYRLEEALSNVALLSDSKTEPLHM